MAGSDVGKPSKSADAHPRPLVSLRAQVTPAIIEHAGNPRAAWESLVYRKLFTYTDIRRAYIRAAFFSGDDVPGLHTILAPEDCAFVWRAIQKDRARLRHMLALLDPGPADRIADVGCGFGGLVWACQRAGAQAVGCDVDRWIIAEGAALGVSGLVVGTCQSIPLATGSLTKIACVNVFEHVPDQEAALAEFRRVLRPGGRVVLYTDNLTHVHLRVALRRLLTRSNWGIGFSGYAGGHTDVVGPREIARLLSKHGFEVLRINYSVPRLPAPVGYFASRFFVAVAQRPCANGIES